MKTLSRLDRATLGAWTLSFAQALAGAYFFVAGMLAIARAPSVDAAFARWHFSPSVELAVGVVELIGGATLVVPRFARSAAWLLGALTLGSLVVHLAHGEFFPALLTPLVLLALLAIVDRGFAWHAPEGRTAAHWIAR